MCYAVDQIMKIFHAVHGDMACGFTGEVPGAMWRASPASATGPSCPKTWPSPRTCSMNSQGCGNIPDYGRSTDTSSTSSAISSKNTNKADAESFLADDSIRMLETDTEATLLGMPA